ncbi:MAG: DUF1858 domain-containing protein [Actinomycetia bacterium]|nr:DUF1858 domain-containing protein [Actinomycetes bacterium]
MEITKDITISKLLEVKPKAAEVLMQHGMHCLGCLIAAGESIEQAASAHGVDIDKLLKEIKES